MKIFLYVILFVVIAIVAFAALEYFTFRTPNIKTAKNASQDDKLGALNIWLDQLEKQKKFNGAILFARDGEIIAQRNIGYADGLQKRPLTDRTSFNLASVSKHFTAYAILMLAHDGKLDIDGPIADYLPELAHFKGVTLRHLLIHTSGIPEYAFLKKDALKGKEIIDVKFLLSWLGNEAKTFNFEPGTERVYINTNYVLLSEIIARVSGQSYAEFMSKRIFKPLKMNDAAAVNKIINIDVLEDRAYGFRKKYYYFGKSVDYDLNYLDGMAGDGNIYASARDLLKWDTALRQNTLLPKDYADQLYEPSTLDNGDVIEDINSDEKYQYGLGLGWTVGNGSQIYTYGGWRGFINAMVRDLDNGNTVIVLSNAHFGLGTFSVSEKLDKWAYDLQ